MKITLIGMSNVGKTYWSKRLEKIGFQRFSCDDYIEKKLEEELAKYGYCGINDVARWMGQPYEKRYKRTSKRYLEFERESLNQIIHELKTKYTGDENIIVDTTGSVIYTGDDLLNTLTLLTTIVYLDTPASIREEMYKSYIDNPKPVIWGNIYRKTDGESKREAVIQCYPKLLKYRTKIYKRWAKISMNYFLLRHKNFDVEDFLYILKST